MRSVTLVLLSAALASAAASEVVPDTITVSETAAPPRVSPLSAVSENETTSLFTFDQIVKLEKALAQLRGKFNHLYERIKPLAAHDVHIKSSEKRRGFPWLEVWDGVGRVSRLLGGLIEYIRPFITEQEAAIVKQHFENLPSHFRAPKYVIQIDQAPPVAFSTIANYAYSTNPNPFAAFTRTPVYLRSTDQSVPVTASYAPTSFYVPHAPSPTHVSYAPSPSPIPVAYVPSPSPIHMAYAPSLSPIHMAYAPSPSPIQVAYAPPPAPSQVAYPPSPSPIQVAYAPSPAPSQVAYAPFSPHSPFVQQPLRAIGYY